MADRPTEKKETAKKDEAYQPLWDTDQSIPEYMALLMGKPPTAKTPTVATNRKTPQKTPRKILTNLARTTRRTTR